MKQVNPQPQEKFLNAVRKQKLSVTIFLVNGVKLTGTVVEFDTFIIKLKKDKNIQMIYKHSISTISSPEFIDFSDDNND